MIQKRTVRVSFAAALKRRHPRLLRALFTDAEWAYCNPRRRADQHFAVRLAAKQATCRLIGRRPFRHIEIHRAESGAPSLTVRGFTLPLLISLTHDGDLAVALVADPRATR